ncbi:hypothetical protein HQ587_02250 [bacterium]|nr:hypothetical protein [bacterium]
MLNSNLYNIIVVILIGFAAICAAQEIQVPMDEDNKIYIIDPELAGKLGMFSDYDNFREARLFQTSDTSCVLEISYQQKDRLLRVRLPFSIAEVEDFRKMVTEGIRQQVPRLVLNQEGRLKLLLGTFGLAMNYGWAVPVSLNVDDAKTFVALYMLTASAGFFFPLSATRDIPVTDGIATLSLYGATRGAGHGILLNLLFAGEDITPRSTTTLGMWGSIIEGVSCFAIAGNSDMTDGTAATIGILGDYGLGWGVGTAYLTGMFDDESSRGVAGTILLGTGLGLWTGNQLAMNQPLTRGDAYLLQTTGLLGVFIAVTATDIVAIEDGKVFTGAAMIGSMLGLHIGNKLVEGKDFTTAQGRLMNLGIFAGGLLGSGFAYLVTSENNDDATPYIISYTLGATGAFYLMYNSYAPHAQIPEKPSALNFNIRPEGLAMLALNKKFKSAIHNPIPLLTINYRF